LNLDARAGRIARHEGRNMRRRLHLLSIVVAAFAPLAAAQDGRDGQNGKTSDPPPQEKPAAGAADGAAKGADDDDVDAALEKFKKGLHEVDPAIQWQDGPCTGAIGTVAELQVPLGMTFTGKDGTRRFITALKNLPGVQIATAQMMRPPFWSAYFSYEDSGHVPDADKDELDADQLLKTLQEGCEEANKERKRRGLEEFDITGWAVPPHYDGATHNLEWGTRLQTQGEEGATINYEVRVLSRVGFVSSLLVCSPEDLDAALPQFRTLIGALAFRSGQRYDEVKPGDPVASAGLTALIVGGAAVLGWKAGLLKYLYKILAAIGVGIAALWRKLTGRSKQAPKPAA
jgi:uncharacterized membrane-anchored protein